MHYFSTQALFEEWRDTNKLKPLLVLPPSQLHSSEGVRLLALSSSDKSIDQAALFYLQFMSKVLKLNSKIEKCLWNLFEPPLIIANCHKKLVVAEREGGASLASLIDNSDDGPPSLQMLRPYLFQMVYILHVLHDCLKFSHRNLGADSFKIDRKTGRIRLTSLHRVSPSSSSQTETLAQSRVVTALLFSDNTYNAPPEILISDRYQNFSLACSPAIDMWSLGCIIFELLSGFKPFEEDSKINSLFRIFKTFGAPSANLLQYPTLMSMPEFTSLMGSLPRWEPLDLEHLIFQRPADPEEAKAIDLLSSLLQIEPSKRITARKAMDHPVFAGLDKAELI